MAWIDITLNISIMEQYELEDINRRFKVKVKGGKTYEADVDFEELMDKLGIDPEDIRDYIE